MKKFKSFLALLLLGGLVVTGCEKKNKNPSDSGGSQQNSGGSQSGDSGSGGGNQGGEGGGQQGGGGEQGGGELPQNSRFVNKKFIVDTVETQPQVAQMETGYAYAYISLFQDSSCELVAPHDDTYDVLFGTYGVNEADNLATMSIKKSFDGLEQLYSWALPTALRTLSLHYLSETDRFQVSMSFTYPATTMTLTLRALPNPPMHIVGDGVPQDPNGDSFNEQYQVEQYRYDQFFGDLSYSTRNLTVNAIVPQLWTVDESEEYVVEQQSNKFHIAYPLSPNSDAYYEVVDQIRDEQGVLQSLRVDAYTRPYGEWQLSQNQPCDADFFQLIQGFVPVRFLETTYVGSENARYYFASSTSYLDYNGVTDPTRNQITNFRVAFENNNLKSVSYKQDARDYSFTVSKYNQTTIELPDISDPSPEDYYSNIENKVFVFSEASGSGLSDPSNKAFVEALYENATLSLFANQNKDAELHVYKTTNDGVNVIDGESVLYGTYNLSQLDETYAKGGFTFVGFLEDGVYQTATGWYSMWYKIETSQIRINLGGNQFLWFNVTNLVPSQTPHPDPSGGGGDPLVDWPSTTVTQYLSALGVTQDSLPSIQHQNITEYTFTPDLASVVDVFMITCANGGSLSATYEGLLGAANFEYDNSEYWYVSPHQEFAVTYSTDGLDNFNICVYKLVAATPAPTASYLSAKSDFENATGIGLPTINNLDADYTYSSSEHWYEFRTGSGAPLGTFETFEDYLDDNLSSGWLKGNLEEASNSERYVYSHTNGDSIELYFATDDNYIVVTFTDFVGGEVPAPTATYVQAASDFEDATGIALPSYDDVEADYYYADDPLLVEFITEDGTPEGIFDVFANSLDLQLTEPDWSRDDLVDNEDHYLYVYRSDSYVVELEYVKDTSYLDLTYSEADDTPVMPTNPAVMYDYNGDKDFVDLQFDNVKEEYYLLNTYFEADTEIGIFMGGMKYLFFEDFVVRDPDTSNGVVTEGSIGISPKHTLKLNESGFYSIYINSSDEIDIVFGKQAPDNPFVKLGSGSAWEHFDLIPDNISQVKAEGYWLDADIEFTIFMASGDWRYYEDIHDEWSLSEDCFEAGEEIKPGCHAIKVLEEGYYNFYVRYDSSTEGGSVIINKKAEPVDVTYKLLVNDYITADDAVVMAWVWGSEDPGHWISLNPQQEEGQFYIELIISNSYTGLIIYRFVPGSTNIPYEDCTDFFVNGDENPYLENVDYWNKTGNVDLPGESGTVNAYF